MNTKERNSLYVYNDWQASANHKAIREAHSLEVAYLYAFLSRISPSIHRSGIYKCHPAVIAEESATDLSVVINAIPLLSDFGISYDLQHCILLVDELVEQYHNFGGNNPKIIPNVRKHLNSLPDCSLKAQVSSLWDMNGNGKVKRNGKRGYPITDGITNPIANPKVNSGVECGGAS
jgi:hypothetical protein